MPPTSAQPTELTDADVQNLLSGEAVRGPRTFRGRELAPLTRGLRALLAKVVHPEDTPAFCDCVLLHLLTEAHAATPEAKLTKRTALIAATDRPAAFRATVNVLIDDYSEDDIREAGRVVDDILKPVDAAEVTIVNELGAKKDAPALGKPSPTRKRARR